MKFTITKEAIEQARTEKQTSIAVTASTTGMSLREQADMMLALAQRLEALANAEQQAEDLRQRMAARGMPTTARIATRLPEAIKLLDDEGRERGVAKLIEHVPPPPRRRPARVERGFIPEPTDYEPEYSEDDEVEINLHGRWRYGIVIDGGMGVWIVEDNWGRKHRVTDENIRLPLDAVEDEDEDDAGLDWGGGDEDDWNG